MRYESSYVSRLFDRSDRDCAKGVPALHEADTAFLVANLTFFFVGSAKRRWSGGKPPISLMVIYSY